MLPLLLQFAHNYDTEVVQLVDASLLAEKKISGDAEVARFISELIVETQKYAKSVIIFDLDSIAKI